MDSGVRSVALGVGPDRAAEQRGGELHAVADAEHGPARIEEEAQQALVRGGPLGQRLSEVVGALADHAARDGWSAGHDEPVEHPGERIGGVGRGEHRDGKG